ncbi:MAG: Crp/Fnr family transcriptional regulator [Campylobacteraceae bacterium]|nr:Crp/Fnr family transcriptional regulator [Campylobacteraceae bacterium]
MTYINNERILKENFIDKFGLSKDDANLVLERSYTKSLKKGEFLYFNDVCYGYAFLKSGAIRAYLVSDTLREITIFTLKDGEECIICNNCFLENFSSNINLSATEDSEILVIPIDLFYDLKNRYQTLQNHILTLVSMRFSSSIKVMEQALFMPLTDRIRNFLQENAKDGSVKITHQEIAMNLGSAREAVSRVLKEMQNSGEILQSKGDIKVMNLSM